MTAEDITFCAGLIGKPWVSGAQGPEAFDCWGLLCHVFRERRGLELPPFGGVDALGLAGVVKAIANQAPGWDKVETPEHFAAVGMSENRAIHHVGLWLDDGSGGGVLHSFQGGGVVFQKPQAIRARGMQHFHFFNYRKP